MATVSGGGVDLFGNAGQAEKYSVYRPTYPAALTAAVVAAAVSGREQAIDVGTGTGQIAGELSDTFASVVGVDQSQAQLDNAKRRPNVEYVLGDAYALPASSGSVDLVTIGQTLHWLDVGRFSAECKRILRPKGVVGVLGYGVPHLKDCAPGEGDAGPAQRAFAAYYKALENMWGTCDRRVLDTGFADVSFPWASVERLWEYERRPMRVGAFVKYLETWSAWNTLKRLDAPRACALLGDLETALVAAAGSARAGDEQLLAVTFPFFGIILKDA